jgi:hypothetical protein
MKTMRELEIENRRLRNRVTELEGKSQQDDSDEPNADEGEPLQTNEEGVHGFSAAVQSSGDQARGAIKSRAKKHLRDNPHLLHALSPERELMARVPNLDSQSAREAVREVGKRQ